MSKEELITKIMESVQLNLGNNYNVSIKETLKNNSLKLTGIVINKKGVSVSPVIYIDQFLLSYEAETSIDTITQRIIYLYKKHSVTGEFDFSTFTDFQLCKDKIIFQLVNTESNCSLLEKIPSVNFLDFSIIFKVLIEQDAGQLSTATITNDIIDAWKVSTETVYEAAFKNTPLIQEAVIRTMNDVLTNFTDGSLPFDTDFMYVLTNKQLSCGCGCMLYPHVLENFAQKIGKDFFILPSSINEVLLVPEVKENNDCQSLVDIVREVNRSIIAQEDFLSDNVYHFSRKDNKITIIQ